MLFWHYLKKMSFGVRWLLLKMAICIVLLILSCWLYVRFNTIPVFRTEIDDISVYHRGDYSPKIYATIGINLSKSVKDQKESELFFNFLDFDNHGNNTLESESAKVLTDTIRTLTNNYLVDSTEFMTKIDLRITNVGMKMLGKRKISYKPTLLDSSSFFYKNYPIEICPQNTYLFSTRHRVLAAATQPWMFPLTISGTCLNNFGSIFCLFDISQAYIECSINSNIQYLSSLSFKFYGACEFVGLEELKADKEVGLDYVRIYPNTDSSPVKLMNGFFVKDYRFYVSSKETQNLQTIRLFAITTIISFLITYFLTCLFNIIKTKSRRFVPKLVNEDNSYHWAVYDTYSEELSSFPCHERYASKEICQYAIEECNKKYRNHFRAVKKHKIK